MTQNSLPPEGSPDRQANYWLTVVDTPAFDAAAQEAFQRWLATSDENREAWRKAQVFWQEMGGLNPGEIAEIEQQLRKIPAPPTTLPKSKPSASRMVGYYAAAAAIFLALGLNVQHLGLFPDYQTAKGGQQTVTLADGSTVLLGTGSVLSVNYTDGARRLTLHDGEAYFQVAPDASRPFTVSTEDGAVTALGTAFDIKQTDGDMRVAVFEHNVKVAFRSGEVIPSLPEGQGVAFSNGHSRPISPDGIKQARAWRNNLLLFKNQPLWEVVAEIERYRPGKILILGQALAQMEVSGLFDSGDPEAALAIIENTLQIKEYRLTGRLIILVSAG